MTVFPRDIAWIIADYCAELKLRDWIQPEAVYANPNIWKNPKAVEAGVLDMTQMSQHAHEAATNPALIKYIKDDPVLYGHTRGIYANPAAMVWLSDVIFKDKWSTWEHIAWEFLSANPNPDAIEMVIRVINANDGPWEIIDLAAFYTNPGAVEYIKGNRDMLMALDEDDASHYWILGNPVNVDSIREGFRSLDWNTIGFRPMSGNSHPWAIEQLRLRCNEIDMDMFAANPGIFHYVTSKKLVKVLS